MWGVRHDANLALARRDDPRGTIRSDQPRAPVGRKFPGPHQVKSRECLGNADNEFIQRRLWPSMFVGSKRRRDKNHGGVGDPSLRRPLARYSKLAAVVRLAPLPGVLRLKLGFHRSGGLGMECTFTAGQALHD